MDNPKMTYQTLSQCYSDALKEMVGLCTKNHELKEENARLKTLLKDIGEIGDAALAKLEDSK